METITRDEYEALEPDEQAVWDEDEAIALREARIVDGSIVDDESWFRFVRRVLLR